MNNYLLGRHAIPIIADKESEVLGYNPVLGQLVQNPITFYRAFNCHAQKLQLNA